MWSFAEICCFRGLIVPKPYVPHQNSLTKGTSLGRWLGPETIPIAWNCAGWGWAVALSQAAPSKVPNFSCFLGPLKSLRRISEIFHRYMHADTDSRLLLPRDAMLARY